MDIESFKIVAELTAIHRLNKAAEYRRVAVGVLVAQFSIDEARRQRNLLSYDVDDRFVALSVQQMIDRVLNCGLELEANEVY